MASNQRTMFTKREQHLLRGYLRKLNNKSILALFSIIAKYCINTHKVTLANIFQLMQNNLIKFNQIYRHDTVISISKWKSAIKFNVCHQNKQLASIHVRPQFMIYDYIPVYDKLQSKELYDANCKAPRLIASNISITVPKEGDYIRFMVQIRIKEGIGLIEMHFSTHLEFRIGFIPLTVANIHKVNIFVEWMGTGEHELAIRHLWDNPDKFYDN